MRRRYLCLHRLLLHVLFLLSSGVGTFLPRCFLAGVPTPSQQDGGQAKLLPKPALLYFNIALFSIKSQGFFLINWCYAR
jgi:hypothetical protein